MSANVTASLDLVPPGGAVLFDAVGTLIQLREPVGQTYARFAGTDDAAPLLDAAFAGVMRGRPPMVFPNRPAAAVRVAERDWWRALVVAVFEAAGVPLADIDAVFPALFDHYAGAAAWELRPGAHALLDALRARGVRTGMVSNFDHRLHAVLAALDLAARLEVVVLPADAGAAKPDARIFHLALQRLGVDAADAIYVGDDADDDIAGATAAGLRAVDVASLR